MIYDFLDAKDIPVLKVSFWQSPIWQSILLGSHQAKEAFYYGNLSGTWILVEIRSIGIGQFGAFAIGIGKDQIGEDFSDFLSSLQGVLQKKGTIFLQIEPIEELGIMNYELGITKPYKNFLTPHTRVLNLTLSEEDILKQMHEKGRYNIRLAEKRGVTIESVETSEENIAIWMSLLSDTTSRDGFAGNSQKYYKDFLIELAKNNMGGLYFACFDNRVIAAGIFVFTDSRAIYYYGVSSSGKEDRKQMAPYLLQWTAILEARKRNIPLYDFLGVADPSYPDDHLRGVTDFKEKFGGKLIELPQKIVFPLSPKYILFKMIRSISQR